MKKNISGLLQSVLSVLNEFPIKKRLWAAYSGGLDSQVLLHAAAGLRPQLNDLEICAVHVHHGLHADADAWAGHCQSVCAGLGIRCEVRRVDARPLPGESPEARARTLRYAVFDEILSAEEGAMTAHHADDQAETLLLQLFRGAGAPGLASMPAGARLGKGWLLRPFLAYSRADLQAYAAHAGLAWIEDSSNTDLRFDRNFLRREILPQLRVRWPGLPHTLCRAATHQARANRLLSLLGEKDMRDCLSSGILSIRALCRLSLDRQYNVLRVWLKKQGLPMPSAAQLERIPGEVLAAGPDRQPIVRWRGGEVRRYRHGLFAMPPLPPEPAQTNYCWNGTEPLSLPLGRLEAAAAKGEGLNISLETNWTVRFRQGGESCRFRGHARCLKKLLQEANIPPWQRPFIPLVYAQNTLAAIPGIGICDGFAARTGEPGRILYWRMNF
ncbi:MAG: tRNA lysidine(34) synthetase TilS [Gammaproteobacteria bacterium]|nr:tRNA lysidine(34) synthetase TilS [Gammaproteobacteria bacterium]